MGKKIVILTGAGISAESGIRTFRGSDGLWEGHRVEDVATPEGFAADPDLVFEFYNGRRRQLVGPDIRPNAAHEALARLEKEFDGDVILITQNIDDLHERGGSKNVLHMHGELLKARCTACAELSDTKENFDDTTPCPCCNTAGYLRPHVVWFGEMPLYMDDIQDHLLSCDIFVAIGTSGQVYPAAGFVELARAAGAHTIEMNLDVSAATSQFDEIQRGPATKTVTEWVEGLLSGKSAPGIAPKAVF